MDRVIDFFFFCSWSIMIMLNFIYLSKDSSINAAILLGSLPLSHLTYAKYWLFHYISSQSFRVHWIIISSTSQNCAAASL